jgi:hypothetical protein
MLFQASIALLLSATLQAQIPWNDLDGYPKALVEDVAKRADFTFETRTPPKRVRLVAMEKLFDHPRLGAAMWRHCQFVPAFFAFVYADGSWSIDDTRGLKGTLTLLVKKPGLRVYFVEGRAEQGRLKTPFAVSARMVSIYRYWEGPRGFESHLQTWTALDSALLGIVARPFRGYIRQRQDEFIAYINGNIATFGEFASVDPLEFQGPLRREGDPVALRDFQNLFGRK